MHIEKMKLETLKPADYNPRIDLQPGDTEFEKLKNSIETFGIVDPIIWNKTTGHVVGGHQRLSVLKHLGYKEIEVSVVEMDLEKEKTLNIALNKVSGDWDNDKLKDLLESLDEDNQLLSGFDEDEIHAMLDEVDIDSLFEEQEADEDDSEKQNKDDRLDVALELLELANDKLLNDTNDYKNSELHQSIAYFLEG